MSSFDKEDFKAAMVLDPLCSQYGCKATWGLGNQIYVYAGINVDPKAKDERIQVNNTQIHKICWNSDLHDADVRKLVHESYGIFKQIQTFGKENVSSKAKQQMVKFSREYRSVIKACLVNLQKSIKASKEIQKTEHLEAQLQLFDMAELVWSLCEILFIDAHPGGMVLTQLLEWLRWHFIKGDKLARDALLSEHPQSHPHYWDAVYSFVLQGRVDEACQMLSVHAHNETDTFVGITELLRLMPVYAKGKSGGQLLSEFEMKWRHWQESCRRRMESGEFAVDEHLQTVCQVLCGDDQAFLDLRELCENWYCMLVSRLLYQNPAVKALDLQYHTQFCINAYGGNSSLQDWDNTLLAALEFDVHQVIKESSQNCGNWWFVSHMTDLLHHCGVLESQTLYYGSNLREFLLLEYASGLMSHQSLWQTGILYLDQCQQFGREYIKLYIEKIPLETEKKAHKVIRMCEERELMEEAKSISKVMGMNELHRGRLGSALSWGLKSKDVNFVSTLAEKFIMEYSDKGDFSHMDLIDNLGSSMLISSKLMFLGKYREFHKIYVDGDFKAAASLLMSLLTARLAPKKFWWTLLTDALPLLETDNVVFSTQQTYELLQCLEELHQERTLESLDITQSKSEKQLQSEEVEKEKFDLMKLALARNLARAILAEGKTNPF